MPAASEATNKSYRVDETYIKVKGKDRYLYRAVDSTGQTIDFLLTATRDADGAKRFFRKVFAAQQNPTPRVVNVDKNPVYPAAVDALKAEGALPRRVRLRQCKYLNNILTAASGSEDVMPPPGLCRVARLLAVPACLLKVPDAA